MTEIYKILNDIAPTIMKPLFNYGLETLRYRAPAIWATLPPKYVHATSLDEFKSKIKSWKCEICRLCRNYQPNLRNIN